MKRLLSLLMIVAFASSVYAQKRTLSGVVKDAADGSPLPGVSVMEKGRNNGAVTDANGAYSLEISDNNAVLIFKFIGYADKEVKVGSLTTLNVTLSQDLSELDEVVVVGYGTQKRSTLTGSISTLDKKILESKPVTNAVEALQGSVAGLVVTREGGLPGSENFDMTIRDFSSINGGNSPLVLIDGMPGSMSFLNPDDIENLSVLKDASAAIYGSRAAGGVILITTKKGKKGKTTIEVKSGVTIKVPQGLYDQPNLKEYVDIHTEAQKNAGETLWWPQENIDKIYNGEGGVDVWFQDVGKPNPRYYFYDEVDWEDALFCNSVRYNNNLSISGGSDRSLYRLSAGYVKDYGFFEVGNNEFDKYNLQIANQYKITNWLTVDSKLAIEQKNTEGPANSMGIIGQYLRLNPMAPVKTPEGKYYTWGGFGNPLQKLEEEGRSEGKSTLIRTNLKTTMKLFKGFDFISQVGINKYFRDVKTTSQTYNRYHWSGAVTKVINDPNSVTFLNAGYLYQNYTNYFNYNTKLFNKHSVNLVAGMSFEEKEYQEIKAWRKNLVSNELFHLPLGDSEEQYNSANAYDWSILSYYGRLNYDFDNKYLIEGTFRYDGSSKFHEDYRWGFFPGVLAAWRLSEEPFIKPLEIFDNLKLRASYGETGNESVAGYYNYMQTINIGGKYPFGAGSQSAGASLGALPSVSGTWETLETKNLGIDFAILKNRLSGTFEVYQKTNKDMLLDVAFPQTLGTTPPKMNSGTLEVKGWDMELSWKDKMGDFSYYVTATLSDSKNELTDLGGKDSYGAGIVGAREGYPINSYFGWVYEGPIKTQEELDEYKKLGNVPGNIQIGDSKYKDVDGNGSIHAYGGDDDAGDLKYLGNTSPRYNYSVNLGGKYKGFDFSVFIQGVGKKTTYIGGEFAVPYNGGHKWYKPNAMYHNACFLAPTYDADGNMTDPGRDSDLPRLSTNKNTVNWNWRASRLRAWDGAYTRIKNIQLGYTLPDFLIKKINVQKLRFYFSGSDLFVFDNMKGGYDPEQKPGNEIAYPFAKSYSFGLELKF